MNQKYLLKQTHLQKWVCADSTHIYCLTVFPSHDLVNAEIELSWKKNFILFEDIMSLMNVALTISHF